MTGQALSVIDWLKSQWSKYLRYCIPVNHRAEMLMFQGAMYRIEREVGRIALQSIQTLIKMKHMQKHNEKDDKCFTMDGNADNYMELDDVVLNKQDQHLVDTAKRLLGYGG